MARRRVNDLFDRYLLARGELPAVVVSQAALPEGKYRGMEVIVDPLLPVGQMTIISVAQMNKALVEMGEMPHESEHQVGEG